MNADDEPPTRRVDDHGRAFKGSQLQVQLYVNRHQSTLDAALTDELRDLEGRTIDWRSPCPARRYRELSDGRFLREVGLAHLTSSMADFWPRGGPVWDAVGILGESARDGLVLLEGKNYPAEACSACRAAAPDSGRKIEAALDQTRQALNARGEPVTWTEVYYQVANRLAWVDWLRRHHVPTWLAFLCFTDDHRHGATTRDEWENGMKTIHDALGVDLSMISRVAVVYLPALTDDRTVLPTA
jgi:hypothetical protein